MKEVKEKFTEDKMKELKLKENISLQADLLDLKAVFVFLKGISKGKASRNSVVTSGIMEDRGGSRLNYRSNIAMYPKSNYNFDGTNWGSFVSGVEIYEG